MLAASSAASVLFPVESEAWQNFGDGTVCRPLPEVGNMVNAHAVLRGRSGDGSQRYWPPVHIYHSFESRAYTSMLQVWDASDNPMKAKKNQTTVHVVDDSKKDLKGQEMNQYVEFVADGWRTGRTMFRTYAEDGFAVNTY